MRGSSITVPNFLTFFCESQTFQELRSSLRMDLLVSQAVALLTGHVVYPSDAAVAAQAFASTDERMNADAEHKQ